MHEWPDTRITLLIRIQDAADKQAWAEFVEVYEPLIFRFAVRRGLQEADARDITQRVLWTVARAAERWEKDRALGRFRSWLATVTSNAVINLVQRDSKNRGSGSSSVWDLLEQFPERDEQLETMWCYEKRCQMYRQAAEQLQKRFTEDVWTLFTRTTIGGEPIETVANELKKTMGAAYAARNRVLAALRKAVRDMELSESHPDWDRC